VRCPARPQWGSALIENSSANHPPGARIARLPARIAALVTTSALISPRLSAFALNAYRRTAIHGSCAV
jgi:hypothetical protein